MAERKNPGIPLGCVSDGGAYLPEREKVRELRMREMGCADIAKQLDIPEGIVILHCLKLGLPATGPCRRLPLPEEDEEWLRYHRREPKYANCPVWKKDHPAVYGQAKEILLFRLQETVVGRAPEARALEIGADENLPGLRKGIPLCQRSIPAAHLLQPSLRQSGPEVKGWCGG